MRISRSSQPQESTKQLALAPQQIYPSIPPPECQYSLAHYLIEQAWDQRIGESTMDLPSLHKAWKARSNTKPFCFFYPFHKRNGIVSTRSRGSVQVEIRSPFFHHPQEPLDS